MSTAFSASLRARPGYVPGPTMTPVSPPSMQMPSLPNLPAIDDSRAPNAVGREWLNQQLTNLPGKYNPLLTNQRTAAQEALAGYGGWAWQADDPATPEREDLAVPTKDPNAALGARELMAVHAQRAAANARGLLDSSFANKAVGAALTHLNEEAKGIVRQYAANIDSIISNQRSEFTDIVGDLVRFYGDDARWLAENPLPPPPPPPDPVAAPGAVGGGAGVRQWTGAGQPNIKTLAAAWGIPESEIEVRAMGGGGFIARPRSDFPNAAAAAPASDGPIFISPKPIVVTPPRPGGPGGGNLAEWASKPNLTPAQVQARWGAGATLIQAGNGKWVIRGPQGGRL